MCVCVWGGGVNREGSGRTKGCVCVWGGVNREGLRGGVGG